MTQPEPCSAKKFEIGKMYDDLLSDKTDLVNVAEVFQHLATRCGGAPTLRKIGNSISPKISVFLNVFCNPTMDKIPTPATVLAIYRMFLLIPLLFKSSLTVPLLKYLVVVIPMTPVSPSFEEEEQLAQGTAEMVRLLYVFCYSGMLHLSPQTAVSLYESISVLALGRFSKHSTTSEKIVFWTIAIANLQYDESFSAIISGRMGELSTALSVSPVYDNVSRIFFSRFLKMGTCLPNVSFSQRLDQITYGNPFDLNLVLFNESVPAHSLVLLYSGIFTRSILDKGPQFLAEIKDQKLAEENQATFIDAFRVIIQSCYFAFDTLSLMQFLEDQTKESSFIGLLMMIVLIRDLELQKISPYIQHILATRIDNLKVFSTVEIPDSTIAEVDMVVAFVTQYPRVSEYAILYPSCHMFAISQTHRIRKASSPSNQKFIYEVLDFC